MVKHYYDAIMIPLEVIPAACEHIESQGFEIVAICDTGMQLSKTPILTAKSQSTPAMLIVARIAKIDGAERVRLLAPGEVPPVKVL